MKKIKQTKRAKCQFCGAKTTGRLFLIDKETQKEIIICLDCWMGPMQKDIIPEHHDEEELTSLQYHEEEGRLGIL